MCELLILEVGSRSKEGIQFSGRSGAVRLRGRGRRGNYERLPGYVVALGGMRDGAKCVTDGGVKD